MSDEILAKEVFKAIREASNSNIEQTPCDINVFIKREAKKPKLPPSIMVFQAAAFLCSTKLNASTNRILMYFFSKSAYENFVGIDVKTLMEELNVSKPTVVNALKDLEYNNILIKYQNVNDKRRHDYFINPISAWKGKSYIRKNQIDKIKSENPDQLDLFDVDYKDYLLMEKHLEVNLNNQVIPSTLKPLVDKFENDKDEQYGIGMLPFLDSLDKKEADKIIYGLG
jgi:hypothetical protein